ncbi:hypothetical protein [Pseudomonas sp. 30_B]|uniref:hypothetical protein n=1 Tax=Pseudomonas sp. 30_B TaxID=2813575 RepID=UPI001FAE8572|nr:hypothetical protein [Pseudomonas sp. 30_B]
MDSLSLPLDIQRPCDNTPSAARRLYLQKLSGVRYLAIPEVDDTYELTPTYGSSKHVSAEDLTDTDVWEQLH